jgi:hypothetical protein
MENPSSTDRGRVARRAALMLAGLAAATSDDRSRSLSDRASASNATVDSLGDRRLPLSSAATAAGLIAAFSASRSCVRAQRRRYPRSRSAKDSLTTLLSRFAPVLAAGFRRAPDGWYPVRHRPIVGATGTSGVDGTSRRRATEDDFGQQDPASQRRPVAPPPLGLARGAMHRLREAA